MARLDKQLSDLARQLGFEYQGKDSRGHHIWCHPETGQRVPISGTSFDGPVRQTFEAKLRRAAPQAAVDALRRKTSSTSPRPKRRGAAQRARRQDEQQREEYEQRVHELEHARLPKRRNDLDERDLGRLDGWQFARSVLTRALDMGVTPVELRAALAAPRVRQGSGSDEGRAIYADERITLAVDETDRIVVGLFWRSEHDKHLEERRHARLQRRIANTKEEHS